jgi:trehalose-6-phosphatase
MKYGSNKQGATLKYLGEEDAIDEIIVFASDDEKGFALFRLLGKKMEPAKMMKLMTAIEKRDLDVSKLESIGNIFEM